MWKYFSHIALTYGRSLRLFMFLLMFAILHQRSENESESWEDLRNVWCMVDYHDDKWKRETARVDDGNEFSYRETAKKKQSRPRVGFDSSSIQNSS